MRGRGVILILGPACLEATPMDLLITVVFGGVIKLVCKFRLV
jgi:hypothetical protein